MAIFSIPPAVAPPLVSVSYRWRRYRPQIPSPLCWTLIIHPSLSLSRQICNLVPFHGAWFYFPFGVSDFLIHHHKPWLLKSPHMLALALSFSLVYFPVLCPYITPNESVGSEPQQTSREPTNMLIYSAGRRVITLICQREALFTTKLMTEATCNQPRDPTCQHNRVTHACVRYY